MPKRNTYGSWPRSGEIDLVEARSNKNLTFDDKSIGIDQIGCTLNVSNKCKIL